YLPIDDRTVVGQVALGRKRLLRAQGEFPPGTVLNVARLGGLSHVLSSPLLVGERLVGALSLARKNDVAFSHADLQLADSCAVHIAVILEHLRLYDDLKKSY